ncbi:bifunctional protein-serine/threonine kinase/phosphatase [Marinobacter salinexigens]|uniref:Bifunctional protein-serine/threonine kinase/phosphatase n=1 Tax=Marinobacter salinexigens TaxID=2919747 RepID=A0A5B0VJ36_9GAMM|nr:bifunctional protein-serine/threonine kinase/phosphatase [Marinobacter salinexigens]KAA1174283.1 bifunctional protein-serine/threonine kinase/phosphatase [Marinobacter salinexigens]
MTIPLQLRLGQHSIAGRKPENQDSLGACYPEGEALAMKGVCAVIADGVSASLAGREAAETCVKGFLHDYYSTPDSWSVETAASRVLGALNRWLHGRGHASHGDTRAMVTTFSGVVIKNNRAYVFHVGDSRVYLLRGGELECLTRDHHVIVGADKQALARAMGVEVNVEIDVCRLGLESGDRLILTTDGIHGHLSQADVRACASTEDPETAAEQLVSAAYDKGSPDNLSAQVIAIDHLPSEDLEAHYERLSALPFPPPLDAGQSLDGYRIVREIHASNRTQVYLVSPPDGGDPVILKTPSPNYQDDAGYIDHFMTETWVARRINNAHVVKAVQPPAQRQCLYSLTEFIDGPTLREWMNDHPQPEPSEVRNIIRQIAAGLRALHRLEMIHQDLKPENIVIDRNGTVKIIDLGSVRIRGIEEIDVPWGRDTYLGTVRYAAPECLDGDLSTPASDRYALGVIAYEMLTGQLPYARPPKSSVRRKLYYRSARLINPDLPKWLDACLEKAVALRPLDRYPALSEFLHDLEHPNPKLLPSRSAPLVARVSTDTWRALALISCLVNSLLLLWLLAGPQ